MITSHAMKSTRLSTPSSSKSMTNMTYDLTITFENGKLSLKGCSKPFSTEDLEGEDPFGLNLGKPKEVNIIFKPTNNHGKEKATI